MNHDGDITPGMNSYCGDVPDVIADLEAANIMGQVEKNSAPDMACIKPGCPGHIVLEAYHMHVAGSGIYCQKHLEGHHGKPLAEILEAKRKSDAIVHYCARCGKRGRWVSGAGEALCSKHEGDY